MKVAIPIINSFTDRRVSFQPVLALEDEMSREGLFRILFKHTRCFNFRAGDFDVVSMEKSIFFQ